MMGFNLAEARVDVEKARVTGAWVTLPCGGRVRILSVRSRPVAKVHREQLIRDAEYYRDDSKEVPEDIVSRNLREVLCAALLEWDQTTILDNDDDGNPFEVEYTQDTAERILGNPTNEQFIVELDLAVADRSHFLLGSEADTKN